MHLLRTCLLVCLIVAVRSFSALLSEVRVIPKQARYSRMFVIVKFQSHAHTYVTYNCGANAKIRIYPYLQRSR